MRTGLAPLMNAAALPTVDIIIPTRNRGSLIEVTITSIRASEGVEFTLWVVDQSDDEQTALVVEQHARSDARIRYMGSDSRGISSARNIGAAAGHAPYILYTDDDCRVDPGWAAAMVAELSRPEIWTAFGRVLPERAENSAEPATDDHDHPTYVGIALAQKLSMERKIYGENRLDLSFGHGANMGLRRDRLTQIGGFDEQLGVGGPLRSWEDRDIAFRIMTAGGKLVYTPDALVYHRLWRNWAGVARTFADYGIGAGATAGKYLRYGDWAGALLMGEWMLSQGLRQALSGAVKWRSHRKLALGLKQLFYPWMGLWMSWGYPLSDEHQIYRPQGTAPAAEAERAHASSDGRL